MTYLCYGPGSYDEDGGWYECTRCGELTGSTWGLCERCEKTPSPEASDEDEDDE